MVRKEFYGYPRTSRVTGALEANPNLNPTPNPNLNPEPDPNPDPDPEPEPDPDPNPNPNPSPHQASWRRPTHSGGGCSSTW